MFNLKVIYLIFILCWSCNMLSQRVLSIEVKNEIETIKIYEGQTIVYQMSGSDEWFEGKTKQFLVNDTTILFENSMLNVRDLATIRIENGTAQGIGKTLVTFGTAWLLYGGFAHFRSERYKFTWGTLAIGATAIGVGLLTTKVAGKKYYRANKNARFRLLDLNFVEDNSN